VKIWRETYWHSTIIAQAKNPPPPIQEPEEKPKLQEQQPVPDSSKLPEGSDKTEAKKELSPEIQTPKVQADLGFDVNRETNVGSSDLSKP